MSVSGMLASVAALAIVVYGILLAVKDQAVPDLIFVALAAVLASCMAG